MAWKGALRNAESRLDVLRFSLREELEALQLTSKQWRRNVGRYSPELALRRIQLAEIDLVSGTTYYYDEPYDPKNTFHAGKPAFSRGFTLRDDDFRREEVDYASAEFDAKEARNVGLARSKFARLKHCFVEWLRLIGESGTSTGVVGTDFETRFCVWLKPLQQADADVHVQTLETVDASYKIDMDTFYQHLDSAFRVREYTISKESKGDEGRADELCVDVVKRAKRVSILYHRDRDDEAADDEEEGILDVDDKPQINGSMENVLDFVFSAPKCEELYVSVEGEASGLITKLIRRFQGLPSTSQMVSTFTCESGTDYEGGEWTHRNDCPKSIAEGHPKPFKDVTLERRRRQFYDAQHAVAVGQQSGDVYEFRNEHDGTYLTVVVSKTHCIVQFRKGRFDPSA